MRCIALEATFISAAWAKRCESSRSELLFPLKISQAKPSMDCTREDPIGYLLTRFGHVVKSDG